LSFPSFFSRAGPFLKMLSLLLSLLLGLPLMNEPLSLSPEKCISLNSQTFFLIWTDLEFHRFGFRREAYTYPAIFFLDSRAPNFLHLLRLHTSSPRTARVGSVVKLWVNLPLFFSRKGARTNLPGFPKILTPPPFPLKFHTGAFFFILLPVPLL